MHLAAVGLLGLRVVRGWPGNPGSDGASPYRLEPRSMLKAIVVVVLVLVLDLLRLPYRLAASSRRPRPSGSANDADDEDDWVLEPRFMPRSDNFKDRC
jgi:hypothetical protein